MKRFEDLMIKAFIGSLFILAIEVAIVGNQLINTMNTTIDAIGVIAGVKK